jgi:hypothetical protein
MNTLQSFLYSGPPRRSQSLSLRLLKWLTLEGVGRSYLRVHVPSTLTSTAEFAAALEELRAAGLVGVRMEQRGLRGPKAEVWYLMPTPQGEMGD